jgi:hypothetical protein
MRFAYGRIGLSERLETPRQRDWQPCASAPVNQVAVQQTRLMMIRTPNSAQQWPEGGRLQGRLEALWLPWHDIENIRHSAELGKRTSLHLPHQVGAMHLHCGFGDTDVIGNLFV